MLRNNNFKERVYKIVKGIKKGKVMTYKEVACAAGSSKAWRAVGNVLGDSTKLSRNYKNKNTKIPCHRVIRSDNKLGGYNKGEKEKVKILQKEGWKIKGGKIAEH